MAAIENETLMEAFMKSDKTLEKVITFLRPNVKAGTEKAESLKCRGRKKKAVQ